MNEDISSTDWTIINDIVTEIYSSIPYPNLGNTIKRIKKLIPFSHSMSCLISNRDDKVEFFHNKSDDISAEHMELYSKKYIVHDFVLWYSAVPEEKSFRETDIIVEKYMADSVFMKEWMSPINAYYGAVCNIAGNGYSYGNTCLYRSKDEGNFTDKEMLILKTINNHLCICFKSLFPYGIQQNIISQNVDKLSSVYHLSAREKELVQKIAAGVARHNLAKEMFISENTIKKHLNSIYQKINVKNFEELMKVINPGTLRFG